MAGSAPKLLIDYREDRMKTLRYLVRLRNKDMLQGKDASLLLTTARKLLVNLGVTVQVVRVSSQAIELDTFAPSEDVIRKAAGVLSSTMGELLTLGRTDLEPPELPKEEAIANARSLFNEERYWESQEALEKVWLRESGEERELLQGMILVGAALVHHQRGRGQVCLSVLKRAHEKLRKHRGTYFGMDIESLKSRVETILDTGTIEVFKI